MTDKSRKSKVPKKEEAPVPTIAPATDPRTDGCGTEVTIIGAGTIGSAVTYVSMIQGVARHYAMLDIGGSRVKVGALDIVQGNQSAPMSTVKGSSDVTVIKDSGVVVIIAGTKRKSGQSHLELAGAMIDIMKSIVSRAAKQVPGTIYLVVTDPVDVVTCAERKLSELSGERLFGSGMVLDSSRFRYLIVLACGVVPQDVHIYITGEYGDPKIPPWSSAMVGVVPLLQWGQTVDGKFLNDGVHEATHHNVVRSAYNIIEGKGMTNYTVGILVTSILDSIVHDEYRVLPASSCLKDWLGISDMYISVPSIVGRAGVGYQPVLVVTPKECGGSRRSTDSIRDVVRQFGF